MLIRLTHVRRTQKVPACEKSASATNCQRVPSDVTLQAETLIQAYLGMRNHTEADNLSSFDCL